VTHHDVTSLYALEVIKHNLSILQITTKLHLLDQMNTNGNIINKYLKHEHLLIQQLFKKTTILNVVVMILEL
jgi:hypothetical protein